MGRVEILTGIERRRNWTDEEKLRILEEAAMSGASTAEVARRHDVLPQQIYTWRKKFGLGDKREEQVVTLLPVTLISPDTGNEPGRAEPTGNAAPKRAAKPSRIEIGCKGGRVLKVDADIAPNVLKALIRTVEEA